MWQSSKHAFNRIQIDWAKERWAFLLPFIRSDAMDLAIEMVEGKHKTID
jgi:hypothetical protein